LTPSGKKRHPLSFSPFLGGKRICLGKTFAETIAKFVVPSILGKYRFEFKDPETMKHNKPCVNIDTEHDPIVFVKLKKIDEFNKYFN
jgi:cytochrome P450